MTFGDKAILFNKQLSYTGGTLPPGIRIMNPFEEFEQLSLQSSNPLLSVVSISVI